MATTQAETPATEAHFIVWDSEAQEHIAISRAEMVGNLMGMATRLGRGTPASGEWERKAIEVAEGGTAGFMTEAQLTALLGAKEGQEG